MTIASCKFSNQPTLPAFNLLLLDSSTIFNTINTPKGKPVILFFFSPDCVHCQNETEKIIKHKDFLNKVSLVYISVDTLERLRVFYDHYNMQRFPGIIMGQDYKYFVFSNYKPPTTPFVAVYDKHKELKTSFAGEFEFDKLSSVIQEK